MPANAHSLAAADRAANARGPANAVDPGSAIGAGSAHGPAGAVGLANGGGQGADRPGSTDGLLGGGTANRGLVVRAGSTVRRPLPPSRAATHALLAHLAAAGFDGAPRVLGTDATTETLTYIDGWAGVPPLRDDMLTDRALISVAEL